jgi:hypothetical protein
VEVAEGFADKQKTQQELDASSLEAEREIQVNARIKDKNARRAAAWCLSREIDALGIARSAAWGATYAGRGTKSGKRPAQAQLLREVFGNPFHPVTVDRACLAWNGGAVVKVAEVIYEERRFGDLSILADALEDAGCTEPDILAHCRSSGPHVRGCWAVDRLLGKE